MKTDVHMSEKLSPKFVLRQNKILLVQGKTVGSSEYSSRSASAMWFVLIQRFDKTYYFQTNRILIFVFSSISQYQLKIEVKMASVAKMDHRNITKMHFFSLKSIFSHIWIVIAELS